ncbi:MAG: hypothetical protein AB7O97_13035 [Planctomycetota bacterium]
MLTSTAPFSNTVYFDLTVTVPSGLIITQFDMPTQDGGSSSELDVYTTAIGGTHTGNHSNPAAWTLVSSATSFEQAAPTVIVLDKGFYLAPGTYGMALHHKNMRHVYLNGATQVPPLPTVFSTAEMSVDLTNGRIQNSNLAAPFSGGESGVRTPNLTIHYQMTSYVHFTPAPVTGLSPLNVQFNDGSVSMDQVAGITLWAWDLDNDLVDETFVQNPSSVYACGDHTVRLTVFDSTGTFTVTRTDVVAVDTLVANWSWTKIGDPAVFQFTDLSSPSATSWAWDLDGIPGTDSTVQNPVFFYQPGCAPVAVSLTASNSCRTDTKVIEIAPMPTLETLFDTNNAGVAGTGNFFDINVTAPDGIEICGMHVNCNDAGGTPFTIDFYTIPGTYVGNDTNPTGWSMVTGAGVSQPRDEQTYVQLATPVYLPPGTHGAVVHMNTVGPAYMGTGSNPAPGLTSYSNADITLSLGQARSAPFGGTLFTPRIWSGRLHYATQPQGLGAYYTFGAGCAGSLGVVGNTATALPHLGQPWTMEFDNVPFGVLPFYGLSNTTFGGFPLPLPGSLIGAPGCDILIAADFNGGLVTAVGNVATWTLNVPNASVFLGLHIYTQALSFDPVNALGGVFSDGATALIGS